MGLQRWVEPAAANDVAVTVGNTTTETSLISPAQFTTFSGNFWYPGKTVHYIVRGNSSNIVTTPGTLAFRAKWGSSITLAATQAFTVNTTAVTTQDFFLDLMVTCRVAGSAANFMLMGTVEGISFGTGGTSAKIFIPTSTPAVGSNVDVSVANFLGLTAQWSIANAGNTITAQNLVALAYG